MTKRANARDEIKYSDEHLKIFFDYAPDAYYLLDSEGTLVDANKAAERLTGYRKEEFIGRKIVESGILDQGYVSKALTLLSKNLLGEPSGPDEFILNRRDGGRVVVEISTYPVEVEGKKLILGIAHDITERKKMERMVREYSENLERTVKQRTEDLEKTMKFLEMIIENVPDLMYIKDKDLKYVLVNDSFCKFFGLPKDKILGRTLYDIASKDLADYFTKQDMEVIETKKIFYMPEATLRDASGTKRVLCTTKAPLKDEEGNVTHIIGVTRDITENKRMEEELLRAERLAAIGETAAMVGHDLRNPLQVLMNLVYLAEEIFKSSSRECLEIFEKHGLSDLCSRIRDQIGYMDKIVSDLQDYARPVTISIEEIKTKELLDNIIENLTIPSNIKVSNEVNEDVTISVDKALMTRVFINLITNAIQAMPTGGKITFRVHESEGWRCISVSDTGVGIPKENLDKIFTPTFTTKAKGQGFGLAVCKKFVEAHNGKITVESNVGEGTKFTVCIPSRVV